MSRVVSLVLVAALLIPQCLVYMSGVSAQTGQNVPAVVVIPFQDLTGKGSPALLREATAAAALALEDSREYLVTSTADLEREMKSLRLELPLSVAQQVRLGERLHVEKVLVGSLAALAVDARTGRAQVSLRLMLLDVGIGEYLDGAVADITTKPIPGFSGDASPVTHEALREAAESAITKMLSTTVRRGAVELVDDQGNINVNMGTNDGLEEGSQLLVMRPSWQPDVEEVIMRRVGIITLSDVEADMSVAHSVSGTLPTTGDRVFRIYRPVTVVQAEAKSRKIKSSAQMVAGLLLILGLISTATGPTTATPSGITHCSLRQDAPGQNPFVELAMRTPTVGNDKTHGFLIFRAANNPDFPAVAPYMIDLLEGYTTAYTDDPMRADSIEDMEVNFTYIDYTGGSTSINEADGSVVASFNHPALVTGTRYYYRIRRISDPLAVPGANPPIGTTQAVAAVIEPTPDWRIITDASAAGGPVTFFTPPLQSSPADTASNLTTTNVPFTWQSSTGANEYRVEIFAATDPDGTGASVMQSAVIRNTSASILTTTLAGPFSGNTVYYWRVGARQSADPYRPTDSWIPNSAANNNGWLYSNMRSFTTATGPPPPPGTSTSGKRTVPGRHGGWWGAGRNRQ